MEAAFIAVGRYNDAVTLKLQSEQRITLAVTTLEALLLKGDEKNELVYRLALRVAALLQQQFEPLHVKKGIKKAYGIRSGYVHGSLATGRKSENEELCGDILEYARVCVQLCLQLHDALGKDSLIALLDDSLLDEDSRNSLARKLLRCAVTR